MVGDANGAPNDLGHPPAGPHLAAEPVRLRPPLHQGRQLGELLGCEPGLAPGGGMAPQRLHPLLPAPLEPLADGARGHPECGSDVLLFPALLFQLPSASPPSLAPVELRALRLHGASIPSFYASTQRSVVRHADQPIPRHAARPLPDNLPKVTISSSPSRSSTRAPSTAASCAPPRSSGPRSAALAPRSSSCTIIPPATRRPHRRMCAPPTSCARQASCWTSSCSITSSLATSASSASMSAAWASERRALRLS